MTQKQLKPLIFIVLIAVLLLVLLYFGAYQPPDKKPANTSLLTGKYELNMTAPYNATGNTTIYYLTAEDTYSVINHIRRGDGVSSVPIYRSGFLQMSTGPEFVTDILVLDENNESVNYTVVSWQQGFKIELDNATRGMIAYTMKKDPTLNQLEVTHPDFTDTAVVILPYNHTTGNMLLGIASPEPDDIMYDENGRIMLIWGGEDHIRVGYYHESTPARILLLMVTTFTVILAVIFVHLHRVKRLREIRMHLEQSISKEK